MPAPADDEQVVRVGCLDQNRDRLAVYRARPSHSTLGSSRRASASASSTLSLATRSKVRGSTAKEARPANSEIGTSQALIARTLAPRRAASRTANRRAALAASEPSASTTIVFIVVRSRTLRRLAFAGRRSERRYLTVERWVGRVALSGVPDGGLRTHPLNLIWVMPAKGG